MVKARGRVVVDRAKVANLGDVSVNRGVRAATLESRRIVVDLLSQPGTGTPRPSRRAKGKIHVASAPGDPPAPDTGILRQSVDSEVIGRLGIVAANAEYAAPLELGTEKMAARPFMSRLLDFRDRIQQAFVIGARR
jgi:hypothetical protein